jgi:hypothetical protein
MNKPHDPPIPLPKDARRYQLYITLRDALSAGSFTWQATKNIYEAKKERDSVIRDRGYDPETFWKEVGSW